MVALLYTSRKRLKSGADQLSSLQTSTTPTVYCPSLSFLMEKLQLLALPNVLVHDDCMRI